MSSQLARKSLCPSYPKLVFVLLVTGCLSGELDAVEDNPKPNIIIMMADDMGMGDTSAYQDFTGNDDSVQLHTPAMEKLARMGVRFTDAHTPGSRCSPTRYGLLTGRYPWRSRLKYWVLFGSQGDPMIEPDRPTIASLCRDNGYRTAMVGKWHVGLRYRNEHGLPAAGFQDASLRMPMADTPLDHGFDFCWFTSRSHGTSGPTPGKKNKPNQNIGPGHIDGRKVSGATTNGRQLTSDGANAYVLEKLGSRHSDNAMKFLQEHTTSDETRNQPFFLYYPSNSNHGPHTPDSAIGGVSVVDAGKNVDGTEAGKRGDYIYENDVALARLLNWLESTDDPRSTGKKLIENTLVIFTSDNGAEITAKSATGPFRSNKGSCFEGGHRVPFIAAWRAGGIGDGNAKTPGRTSEQLICLTDMYATLREVLHVDRKKYGDKGGEDSFNILPSLQTTETFHRPVFFHDHKESKADPAVAVLRFDNPVIDGKVHSGQWKLFFTSDLLRAGKPTTLALFDLATDSMEQNDRVHDAELEPLVKYLANLALTHRTAGGHHLASNVSDERITFDWTGINERGNGTLARQFNGKPAQLIKAVQSNLEMTVRGVDRNEQSDITFSLNGRGLGLSGGRFHQVDDGEALVFQFSEDVIVESVSVLAGNGVCGGYYQVGDDSKLAVYCVDADIDSKDQSGILSDIGFLKSGQPLRLDSTPLFPSEAKGRWRLSRLIVRRVVPSE